MSIKLILEIIQILISAYKFFKGEISNRQFHKIVNERKKNYDEFINGDRKKRLEVLKDENKK